MTAPAGITQAQEPVAAQEAPAAPPSSVLWHLPADQEWADRLANGWGAMPGGLPDEPGSAGARAKMSEFEDGQDAALAQGQAGIADWYQAALAKLDEIRQRHMGRREAPDHLAPPRETPPAAPPRLSAVPAREAPGEPEGAWDAFNAAHDDETFTGQQEAVQDREDPGGEG